VELYLHSPIYLDGVVLNIQDETKREKVTGGWRRLHNEELHNLYTSPNIIRVITLRRLRWSEHVARMGEMRNAYNILVGNPERKRLLGRPRWRWEDILETQSV
jgi:hypothetical protein